MLGVTLTAQRAGWAATDPVFRSRSIVSQQFVNAMGDGLSLLENDWTSPDFGNNISLTFDDTALGSDYAAVWAVTIRFDEASEYTFNTDIFLNDFQSVRTIDSDFSSWTPWLVNIGTSSGEAQLSAAVGKTSTGKLALRWDWGTYREIPFDTVTWNGLANTWVTIIVCSNSDKNVFGGWTGGTQTSDNYVRALVVNATTGELLDRKDIPVGIFLPIIVNPSVVDPWTPTWPVTGEGDFNTQTYAGDVRNGLLLANGWFSIGDDLDPLGTDSTTGLPYYRFLSGQGLPGTVGGSRAWCNWYPTGTYTATGPVDPGPTDQWNGLYRLGPCRLTQATSTYSFMPVSFHESPLTDSDRP